MNIGKQITYKELSDGLEVVIKPKKHWLMTVVGIVGLFFLLKEFFNFILLLLTGNPVALVVAVLFSFPWIVWWAIVVYMALWRKFGEEVVSVSPDAVSVTKLLRFFGIIGKKTFLANNISSMRSVAMDPFETVSKYYSLASGFGIFFEHLDKTDGFGFGLEAADARELIGLINKHIGK